MSKYLEVTELAGDEVTSEQVERLCNRYYWAGGYCGGKDVVEIACGTGQGLGYLASIARHLQAGDYSSEMVEIAKSHYKQRVDIQAFDAHSMPYADASFDVVIIFEAVYYLQDVRRFVAEVRRVLRSGGKLLIATANKDLADFNPSPFSVDYYGVAELQRLLSVENGFSTEFFGYMSVTTVSFRQKVLRPIKKLAVALNLMPKTMAGKKLLKKLVFGKLVRMPSEISSATSVPSSASSIVAPGPNRDYKVIYCAATKM